MAAATGDIDNLRKAWKAAHLAPLWESPTAHKPPAPPDPAHLWAWEAVRPLIAGALSITDPHAVERRVLSLINPNPRGPEDESTARTLSAALQILLPGETARPHRHSMNAIRFVLEGSGALTIVNGKACPMEVGDLIITPGWCWHEHTHKGTGPMIWLDALDVPLHLYLGTAEFQPGPIKEMPETIPDAAFAGANLVPDVGVAPGHSPVFRYPYEIARSALEAAPLARDGARRIRYINPANGGAAMPVIDCHLVEIGSGGTVPFRTNANAVATVVEGSGSSRVGNARIEWREKDIFTLPSGNWIEHKSGGAPAKLFVASDRDAMTRLGVLKEEYGNSPN
jgi:gentisate 1,2-dioxygenase